MVLQVEDPWVAVPFARSPMSLQFSRVGASSSSRLDRFYIPWAWRDRVMVYAVLPRVVFSDPIILNLATTEDGIVFSKNFQQFFRMNLGLLDWEDTRQRIEGAWRMQEELPPSAGAADLLAVQAKTLRICRLAGKRKCAREKKTEVSRQEELV